MSMWDKLGKSVAMGAIIISLGAFGCMGGGGGSGDGGGNGGSTGAGNNGGGNNGGGDNGGGSKLANRLFGGGGAQSGTGGSGAGAGGSIDPGGATVNQASCVLACTDVLDCFVATCEFAVNAADMALGVQECTAECLDAATPADMAGISNLTANSCAEFNALAGSEGWCGEFDEDDFDPDPIGGSGGTGPVGGTGGTGPVGGSGGPVGDCAIFCGAAERCCGEDPECTSVEDMFGTACENICSMVPAETMSCVVTHANDSCMVLDAECDSGEEDQGGSGGSGGGGDVNIDCNEALFCATITCTEDCFDAECEEACMAPCQANPQACVCPDFNAMDCF